MAWAGAGFVLGGVVQWIVDTLRIPGMKTDSVMHIISSHNLDGTLIKEFSADPGHAHIYVTDMDGAPRPGERRFSRSPA